jgi:membrane protein YdbS with pleckstrin-like domain
MRTLNNYTLEIASPRRQPKYLGILSLCMAAPAVLTSSLVGAVVDWSGFDIAFIMVLACVFTAWILTFRLKEPRANMWLDSTSVQKG